MLTWLNLFKYRILAALGLTMFRKTPPKDTERPSFFIIGSGRNGSTLLAAMLNNHPELFIPPEQHAIPYHLMNWYLNPFKSKAEKARNLIEKLSSENKSSSWQMDATELMEIDDAYFEDMEFSELVDTIFRNYLEQDNEETHEVLWGDKTPLNTHFIKTMWPDFRESKYIFLIRDPRDVVLSCSKIPDHPTNKAEYAIWKWKDSIRQYKFLKRKKADLMLLQYEDLVRNPEKTLRRVVEFLNKKYIPNLTNHTGNVEHMGVENRVHHQNLKNPVNPSSVGRWKEQLSNSVIKLVERKCQKEMKEFGYI